jgi:hypothetical protein
VLFWPVAAAFSEVDESGDCRMASSWGIRAASVSNCFCSVALLALTWRTIPAVRYSMYDLAKESAPRCAVRGTGSE